MRWAGSLCWDLRALIKHWQNFDLSWKIGVEIASIAMDRKKLITTQQTKTRKVNTVSCILLNIVASIYRFESFTWISIQILYIHGHFKLRNMKLHVLMIKLTHWAWGIYFPRYFVLSILFRLTFFDLNLVFRWYLHWNDYLTCFLKFYSCFLELLTEFMAVDNFNYGREMCFPHLSPGESDA